jgi:RHS repeat-associated protein
MAMKTRTTLPLGVFSLLSSICIAAVFVAATGALAQAPSGNVVISSNTTWASGTYQVTSLTVQGGATLTIGGGSTVNTGQLIVTGNSTIVVQTSNITGPINVPGGIQWQDTPVFLNVGLMEVDAGSSISADMQGYVATAGPGAGAAGSTNGGSHCGAGGGQATSTVNCAPESAAYRTNLGGDAFDGGTAAGSGGGSAGGTAGAGGGGIKLYAATITLNGTVTSNGGAASGAAGGGSGGGIFIYCIGGGSITGSGSISANGGNALGNGSGGGGGSVTVVCGSMPAAMLNSVTTTGGTVSGSGIAGGSGYVAFGIDGAVVIDSNTTWASGIYQIGSLTVQGGATLTIGGDSIVQPDALLVTGNSTIVVQSVNNTGPINVPGGTQWQGYGSFLQVYTMQVDAGSSVNADMQGYVATMGPGAGTAGTTNGGSCAGAGGGQAPSTAGNCSLGSGGASAGGTAGAGGGEILLFAQTLTLNGTLTANGGAASGAAGGGSGGGVFLSVNGAITGSGSISANGGNATGNGSGGGGGAVTVTCNSIPAAMLNGISTTGGTASGSGIAGSAGVVDFLGYLNGAPPGPIYLNQDTTFPAGSNITFPGLTIANGATLTLGGGSTLTVTGALVVTGNSSLVLQSVSNSAQVNGTWQGAGATVNAGSVQVDAGSSINADGQGYLALAGPGAGPQGNGVGGSYGGLGGAQTANLIYGSASAPVDLGSGGGVYNVSTGVGGGAIRLIVTGTLTNNGVISANGASVTGSGGGGAGGSVYVTTGTLAGSGVFTANGGANLNQYGTGGGGGRVAIYYAGPSTFTGFTTSTAAGASLYGTVGTVAFFDTSAANNNLEIYQNFPIPASSNITYNSITVQNAATLTVGGGSTISVTGSILVTGNSSMVLQSINNAAQVNGTWQGAGVTLNAGSVQVDAGSSINADGQGYLALDGPGAGPQGNSIGGSYGGLGGGQLTNLTYGSASAPTDLGSGAGVYNAYGGVGGGAIRLIVSGTLTNNGIISANGASLTGEGGGGAGGSVYVTTATLAGSGVFTANGGSNTNQNGQGGGGGRVAIYYAGPSNFTSFATSVTAGGTPSGSVGTVVFFDTSSVNDNLDVYQDFTVPANSTVTYNSITIRNGAVMTIGGGSTVNVTAGILVTANSSIILQSINNSAQVNGTWQGTGVTLNAATVQVDPGSSINADGQGYTSLAGPGGGIANSFAYPQGGSYGGAGGGQPVSTTYGSAPAPTDLGSGGGVYNVYTGVGGGAIRLIVTGTLTNNGIISANAAPVTGAGGGGAGGSVYVTTGTLAGAGIFTANGGSNTSQGGAGGGGGRIAVYYASQTNYSGFATSTANGGTPSGLVGTVAFFDTSATNSNVSVYQAYVLPANSNVLYNSLTVATGATVTIGGGSQIAVAQKMQVTGTVVAQSLNTSAQVNGAWQGKGVTISAGTLQVDSTGSLNADGQGYLALAGPGAGPQGNENGGSYGGLGGGQPASTIYGSATAPVDLGSGGGVYNVSTGVGGGAIRLIVTGTLTNNGIISANGAPVTGSGGGGAGGSVYVTTATLAGSGIFTANGGADTNNYGNGGGGGRVAIYYAGPTSFTGFSTSVAAGGTPSGSVGTVAFFDTSVPNNNVSIYQSYVLPANSNVQFNSLTVANGATVTIGGGSQVVVAGTLHVTGSMLAQSINNTGQVNGTWQGQGVKIVAESVLVDAGASINADGQGYPGLTGPGSSGNSNSPGGSYGGAGGGQSASTTYGASGAPVDLGSGGGSYNGQGGGGGGGAIQFLVSGAITNNGIISANGLSGTGYGGAGSGGSLNIAANTLSGTGVLAANGGSDPTNSGTGGGGGGRIAVYYVSNNGFTASSATATGGTGSAAGANGTVEFINQPVTSWIVPTESVVHGVETLEWFTDNGGSTSVTIAGPLTATIATSTASFSIASWDTTQVPDGTYQLVLSVLNISNQTVQQVDKTVVVNNSVLWHSGTLTTSQTWSASQVQAIDGDVIVPAGVTLTIDPGTIVKVLADAQIIVQAGGTLIATGTTNAPVTFTTFDDYSIGGDTDFNQGTSLPAPGEWNGIGVLTGGVFTSNTNTIIRYAQTSLSGTLSATTTLYGTQVYSISGTMVVPSGVTLNIQPGTVIKFNSGAGMDVQPGSTLIVNGTLAQPIYFTSINDISIGGDANGNGGATPPAPGDWNSIILDGATVSLQHVQMQYGGGPVTSGSQVGMIETTDNANVTIADSVLAYSFFIGIQTGYPSGGGDTVTVTDTAFYGIEDRAINAYGGSTVHVVNDTFDGNAYGVFSHGGSVDVENSIISNSIGTQFGGIELCCGGTFTSLINNDVYTTAPGTANYTGLNDPTGTNGNISANPVYMNGALHDYRPTYGSPAIDAANGTVPNYPLTDTFGLPRYNDPLVITKTGTPDINGNYPDMGAFEFVQTAPSNLDLTVSNVQGPSTVTAGTQAQVSWTVTNIGSGTAYGPWHDAVYLVSAPNTNPVETYAGISLQGAGVVLGPGASYNATATVTVPGTVVGSHNWEVKTNVLGEIFEGANATNNTGVSLNPVVTDLTQLVAGASPLSGSFSGSGQSTFYKVIPNPTQATQVQLSLSAGTTGSVQLFVGAGYVPTPQHYDLQQVEFDSPTASVVIPSDSTQIYYVTAYAQTIPVSPSAYTIQASAVQFSVTSVQPTSISNFETQMVTFQGGGFTSGATYELVGSNNTVYPASSVFITDSTHAQVTFIMQGILGGAYVPTGVPNGTYTAQVVEGGTTASLSNALTVTTIPLNQAGGFFGTYQVNLQAPQAFRTGFPSEVTLNYQNITGYDQQAPVIWITATGATLSEIAPPCSGCNSNFPLMYQSVSTSGLVLGIQNEGPAGILPAGAQGSIKFLATPTGSGNVTFTTQVIDPAIPDPLIGYKVVPAIPGCFAGPSCNFLLENIGLFADASALCSAYLPPGYNPQGFTRTCIQFLQNVGYGYGVCPVPNQPIQGSCGSLDGDAVNNVLAADASALSKTGIYEYDTNRLMSFEWQNDGLDIFNRRYHQGAFGFGQSHAFDITATALGFGWVVNYPDGSTRTFAIPSPSQTNQYLGVPGDYGVLTINADGTWTLTETNGMVYHFKPGAGPLNQVLDYIQDLNGNRITATYTNGLVTSVVDSVGNTISFVYDSLGHITQSTDPVGRVTSYTYDIKSDTLHSTFLTSISDSTGTTSFAWNEGGPSGVGYFDPSCVTTYCEPAIGVNTVTYPNGTHTYYNYDALGRMTNQYRDGSAETVNYTYGPAGAMSVANADGDVSQVIPNQYGVVAQSIDSLGLVTQLAYDPELKLTQAEGPMGSNTSLGYDSQDNVALLLDPLNNQLSVGSTVDNRPQSLTTGEGNTTGFTYDSDLNLTGIAAPGGSTAQYTYDSFGNVKSWTNRRGHTINFAYNSKNLLTSKTYANGSNAIYTYDGHDNLQTLSDSNGTTTFGYDSADRLTVIAYPNGKSIEYFYNPGGQRTSMMDSTGFTVQYAYDSAGRLSQLSNGSNALIVSYTYDAAGRLTKELRGNGTYTTYAYDANQNPLHLINNSAGGSVLSEFDYTYDALGRATAMTAPSGAWTYGYDANSEITNVTSPGSSVAYTYDADGNRLTGAGLNYNVNNLDEYAAIGANSYAYDADGNLISGAGWTYTYDDDNRLIGMVSATDSWSYQYDGLNNRVSSTHNGVVTQYLNDPSGFGAVEAEFTGSGQLVSHFTFGLGLTSAVPASGSPAYYSFDAAGNTSQMTDASGNVVNSYTYLPFGEKIASSGSAPNPFTYVGRYGVMDEGSGLYFMRYRWYSPTLGRFVQLDPTSFEGGDFNLYRYVGNNPANSADPTGTREWLDILHLRIDFSTNASSQQAQQNQQTTYDSGVASQSPAMQQAQMNNTVGGVAEQAITTGVMLVAPHVGLELEVPIFNAPGNVGFNMALHKGAETLGNHVAGITEPEAPGGESPESPGEPGGAGGHGEHHPGPNPEPGPAATPPYHQDHLKNLKDMVNFFSGGLLFNKQPQNNTTVPTARAIDPNGKLTSGFGNQGFVPPATPIIYTIYFENQPTATAPAEKVVVSDPLPGNLDWSTVQLSQIQFNNVTINVPGGVQSYSSQVSVSTDPNPVSVNASINTVTGVLSWTMQSVDPTTGGLPANPLAGFLPPNNSSNLGTGYVTFSVTPKAGLANGTTIANQGSIVFDVNSAISTNSVTNTIDSVYPTSSVAALPATTTSTSFPVSWSGTDPGGSGIADYDIYVSTNSGDYSLWLPATTQTSGTYTGAVGQTYSFYSMATDNVGLRQQAQGAVQIVSVIQASSRTTPSVTVSPASSSITTTQALSVTVVVNGGSGNPAATGSVTLTSGSYTSVAAALISGSATILIPAGSLALGSDTLTATYAPDANISSIYNAASGTSAAVSVAKATPTVAVSPSLSSITAVQSLTVTVAVSGGAGSPAVTGSVTLTSGSYTSAATALSSGNATINVPAGSLALGSDTLTASYAPDSNDASIYNTASGTSTAISVAKATPSVTVSPSSFSITSTQLLSVTVAVNGGTGSTTPTGSVTLTSGSYTSAATPLAGGSATINIPAGSLAAGGDVLGAAYAPDSSSSSIYNSASGSSSIVTVAKATPTITATPSLSSITATQAVSVTIAVGGTPAATGTVTLSSGSYTSAATTLTGGSATINIPAGSLAVGADTLTASYTGDNNYNPASGTAAITVTSLAPTITFTVPNHTYGDAPFTVTATSNSSGAITYSAISGPAAISGSLVTLSGVGAVVLQASQAAAGSYASGSQNATFTVASESQTITFAAPASPVNYGAAPIALSASSTSGLTVVFSVLSGPASISGSTLTISGAGTVVVAADQSGNTNYAVATEVTHSITVNKGAPAAGLTASPNPVLVQNSVTLTATIGSSAGTPTGSVAFSDGGTTIGTAPLNAGIATLSLATLAVGSHSITAVYGGDANFNAASSAAVSEAVEDFTLTIGGSGSSQTVQPGGTATYTLPMSPSGGTTFPAAVTFAATGLPTGFTATFSPASLAAGSSATNVTLTIQVPLTAELEQRGEPGRGVPLIALGLLVLPFLGGIGRSRKWLRRLALLTIVFAGMGGMSMLTGCGGGGGGGGSQPQTYTITVTATSGALSHSTTVTLIVQ